MATISTYIPYIIGFVFIVLIGGGILFFFLLRGGRRKKFPFILYSLDGEKATIITARVKIDKQNPSKKVFFFENFDATLDIREPTWYFGGTAYRECMQDHNGELQYIKRDKIDKDKLRLAIAPEEKALALYRYKENQRRYENPMDKTSAAILISGFILVLLIMIGIIYSTIAYAGAIKNVVTVAKEVSKTADTVSAISQTNQDTTEQLVAIAAALTGDINLTRRVS